MTGTDPTGHYLIGYGPSGGTAPPPRGHPQSSPSQPSCSWSSPWGCAVQVWHNYVVPAAHVFVHVVVVVVSMTQGLRDVTGLLARGLALAGHLPRDLQTWVADAARVGGHFIAAGLHRAVAAGAAVAHNVARWAVTGYHQVTHGISTAYHTVAHAASALATYVKNHAAAIAAIAVSAAVFVGCDAALGIGSFGVGALAGAAACGALAGAAGNAVAYGITAAQTGHFSWSGLASAAASGEVPGAVGGLYGGLEAAAMSAIGDAVTGLLADGAQSVSADAAASDAATGANDAATTNTTSGADTPSGATDTPSSAPSGATGTPSGDSGNLVNAPEDTNLGTHTSPESCLTGGASFTPGTKVLTATGALVAMSKLRTGEKVLATSTRTGKTTARAVAAVLVHHDTNRYNLTIRTAHRTAVIHTTRNHLFWNPYLHQWIPSNKLTKGEHLKTPNGVIAVADGGTTPKVHDGWMWDLTVSTDHDFYVHTAAGAILVHNCPSAGPEDPGGGTTPQPGPHTMRAVWDWVNKVTGLGGDAGATGVPPFSRSAYGNLSDEVRNEVLGNNPTCVYCGENPATEVDHIVALRQDWETGGWSDEPAARMARMNEPGNLVGACRSCNASKGWSTIGTGPGEWWPPGWSVGEMWPFGGPGG